MGVHEFSEEDLAFQYRDAQSSHDDIIRLVAREYHLRYSDLVGPDRYKTIAFARHVAMYLCKMRLKMSFPEIGKVFGRDHTTIISAVNKIRDLRNDMKFDAIMTRLERMIQ